MTMNRVLDSAKFIAEHSEHVAILEDNVDSAAQTILGNLASRPYTTGTWNEHPLHPKTADAAAVDWIFLVDLLNFSFWSDLDAADRATPHPDRFAVSYRGKLYTGYWSLCAAINRALDEGVRLTDPAYYRDASYEELSRLFRSDTKEAMPMLRDRIQILHETGKVLCERFEGSFVNCIRQAKQSSQTLVDIVVQNFPSFRDIHTFHDRQVFILKRAQILVADLWACFDGKGFGQFEDIDSITMFADYRVPQALHHLQLLAYSDELVSRLEKRESLPSGSPLEVEIRGNSIWAVELLRQRIGQLAPGTHMNAILLDFYIWDFAKEHQDDMAVPTHCTRSCFY